MPVRHDRDVTVCECCALLIANGDDSGCRDYHQHDHEPCDLGLEPNETAAVELPEDGDSPEVRGFRCAGCGDDYVGHAYTVAILTSY